MGCVERFFCPPIFLGWLNVYPRDGAVKKLTFNNTLILFLIAKWRILIFTQRKNILAVELLVKLLYHHLYLEIIYYSLLKFPRLIN